MDNVMRCLIGSENHRGQSLNFLCHATCEMYACSGFNTSTLVETIPSTLACPIATPHLLLPSTLHLITSVLFKRVKFVRL